MRALAPGSPALAQGCETVLLDLGANVGTNVRELYKPDSGTGSGAHLATFDRFYGYDRDRVCAFAFEPSPLHAARLRELATSLSHVGTRSRARRVLVFHAAISANNSQATLYSDGNERRHQWGASLHAYNRDMRLRLLPSVVVPTVSFDFLLRTHVLPAAPKKVLVKMDIEGAEHEALPPAVEAICAAVDILALELHGERGPWLAAGFRSRAASTRALMAEIHRRHRQGKCRTEALQVHSREDKEWTPF